MMYKGHIHDIISMYSYMSGTDFILPLKKYIYTVHTIVLHVFGLILLLR